MAIDHNSNNAQAEYKKLNGKRVDVLLPPDSYRLRVQLDAYSELDEYNLKYSASAYSENVTITGDTTITTDVLNVQITAETNALNGASTHLALYAHFKKSVLRSYGLPENIQQIPSNIQGEDRKKLEALIGSSTFYDFAVKMGMCQNYNPVVYDSGKGQQNEQAKLLLERLYQARINSGYAMHY